MANPRTAAEVMVEFLNRFLSEQDQVNDTAVGSETYSFARSIGRLASEIEAEATLQLQQNRRALLTGDMLDLEASDNGVAPRKPAQKAVGKLIIRAANGTTLAAGTQVKSRATQFLSAQTFVFQQAVSIGQAQESFTNIIALKAGKEGNVDPGLITELTIPNRNVFEVFNPERTAGGDGPESDESLRERINLNAEKKRGGTRAAIRGAVLAIPGVQKVETIAARPSRGDCTIVMSDITGGLTSAMIAAAKTAVLGNQAVNPPLDGVGTDGIFYFFVPPRRLIFDATYQIKATQEADLSTIAINLRAAIEAQVLKLMPGQTIFPADFAAVAQGVAGVLSVESVDVTATRGLQILTGVTITGFKLLIADGHAPRLRYVATERSFSFENGPRRVFTASGQVRLLSLDGLSYLDIAVDIATIPVFSATEFIETGLVTSSGLTIGADELPVTGNVTVVRVS